MLFSSYHLLITVGGTNPIFTMTSPLSIPYTLSNRFTSRSCFLSPATDKPKMNCDFAQLLRLKYRKEPPHKAAYTTSHPFEILSQLSGQWTSHTLSHNIRSWHSMSLSLHSSGTYRFWLRILFIVNMCTLSCLKTALKASSQRIIRLSFGSWRSFART